MTTTLRSELDLRPALEAASQEGAAFVEQALDPDFLDALQSEIRGLAYERMDAEEGQARQAGDEFQIIEPALSSYPSIQLLGHDLAQQVHREGSGVPGYQSWRPNEVYVQRYHAGDLGITPHRDYKRYHYLIAIFTADGEAPFTICKNRAGDPLVAWTASVGSLVLLRAPRLNDEADGRLLHTVGGPASGQRISVTYRMDTSVPDHNRATT